MTQPTEKEKKQYDRYIDKQHKVTGIKPAFMFFVIGMKKQTPQNQPP